MLNFLIIPNFLFKKVKILLKNTFLNKKYSIFTSAKTKINTKNHKLNQKQIN